jgi:hypothetical protein
LSSNQGGREISFPEQVLSNTVKIRYRYVLGAETKIKRNVVKSMHNYIVIIFEDLPGKKVIQCRETFMKPNVTNSKFYSNKTI